MPRSPIISMLLFRGLIAIVAIADLAFAAPGSAITHHEIPSVASLDYRSTETLLSLGIVPTAVIDSNTPYFTLRGAVKASNLGTIIQPNLEFLSQISPELVLTSPEFKHMTPRLSGIATVKSLTLYSPEFEANSWQRMTSFTREVGEAVDAADLAEEVIQEAEAHFQSLRKRIADDQIPPLLIVRLMDHKHARVFGNPEVKQ